MSKNLSENEIKNIHDNYVVPTYSPKMAIVKGKGAWVWVQVEKSILIFVQESL